MKKLIVIVIIMLVIFFCLNANEKTRSQNESDAVKKTARDYIENWFDADAAGLDRVLHKEFAKRSVFPDEKTNEEFFLNQKKEDLIKGAQNYRGNIVPKNKRKISIDVFFVYGDMASACIETATFIEYLHLARTNSEWKIINSIYAPRQNKRKTSPVNPTIYHDLIGIYEFPQGFRVTVSTENRRLFLKVDGQPHFEVLPESKNRYFLKSAIAQVEFIRDSSNNVIEMITYQPAGSLTGKKIE